MSLLEVQGLTHSFGEKELYHDVTFSLYKGEHMGIVGQNGSGKSTLLKLLLSELTPSGGQITWQRGLNIGHIDQHAQVPGDLPLGTYLRSAFVRLYDLEARLMEAYAAMGAGSTPRELKKAATMQESLEAAGFYQIDQEVERVAAGLGLVEIGLDRPMGTLSGGQQTKAILAKLLLSQPEVLLLDEPTNFLDSQHIEWLTGYLNAFAGSFMIVSHDFAFLDAITGCILDIEFHTARKYHGRYQDFVRQKTFLREDFQRRLAAQQREISQLEDYISKNRYRAATARMTQGRIKKLDKIERLTEQNILPKPQISFAQRSLADTWALRMRRLSVGYDRPLLPPLDFSVRGGEKVVVTGFNGIGKSTLMKTLIGELPALTGDFAFALAARVGYFEQDLHWASPEDTPLDLLLRAHPGLLPKQARAALSRYGIRADHVRRPIGTLSGGEQNRVKLCRLALLPSNFLILDEPTNHLDAETKEALGEAIAAYPGSVLLVCHEPAFYRTFVDRVLNMEKLS